MMILVILLVTMSLTTLSESTPLSFSTYQRRGLTDKNHDAYLPYSIDGRETSVNEIQWPQIPEEKNMKVANITTNKLMRMKRMQSLSINNSLDVLRDRVLLELARRKAQQDHQQIMDNREILRKVGKRKTSKKNLHSPQHMEMQNELIFGSRLIENPDEREIPLKDRLDKAFDWYNMSDDTDIYENNNQLQQIETNGIDLW